MSVPNHCVEVNKQPPLMARCAAPETHLLTMRNKYIDTNEALLYTIDEMLASAKQPLTAPPATKPTRV
jgi:hypothetical protein